MLQLLHEHDFATDAITAMFIHQFGLVVDLGCIILSLTLFIGESDYGVGALT